MLNDFRKRGREGGKNLGRTGEREREERERNTDVREKYQSVVSCTNSG